MERQRLNHSDNIGIGSQLGLIGELRVDRKCNKSDWNVITFTVVMEASTDHCGIILRGFTMAYSRGPVERISPRGTQMPLKYISLTWHFFILSLLFSSTLVLFASKVSFSLISYLSRSVCDIAIKIAFMNRSTRLHERNNVYRRSVRI